MGTVSFQDGDAIKRFTNVEGAGTQVDPYIFVFKYPSGFSLPTTLANDASLQIRDGTIPGQKLVIDSNGAIIAKFIEESAAPLPSSSSGIIGLIRGLWGTVKTFADAFGLTIDAANSTGSLLSRIRFITNSFIPFNRYVRYGNISNEIISINPALVYSIYVWNKSDSVRYLQLFNITNLPTSSSTVAESFVLAPNEKYNLTTNDFGIGGALFSIGLSWGFSTTETTFNAGLATDVSIIIRWRSN